MSEEELYSHKFDFEERLRGSIKISIDFLDCDGGCLLIKFYGRETYYNSLAEYYQYYLQLRPYGLIYNKFFEKVKSEERKLSPDEGSDLLNIYYTEGLEMADLDPDDINNYPPFCIFENKKRHKFRRYKFINISLTLL